MSTMTPGCDRITQKYDKYEKIEQLHTASLTWIS